MTFKNLFSFILISSIILSCQETVSEPSENYLERNDLKGPVKTIIEYDLNPKTRKPEGTFSVADINQNGFLNSIKLFSEDSLLLQSTDYNFENGLLQSEVVYDSNDQETSRVQHTYEDGNLVKSVKSQGNQTVEQKFVNDDQGRMIEQNVHVNGKLVSTTNVSYSEDKKTTITIDHEMGAELESIEIEDEENAQTITKSISKFMDTEKESTAIVKHDSNQLPQKGVVIENGDTVATVEIFHKLDSMQNWILRTRESELKDSRLPHLKDGEKETSIEMRKIEYYKD